MEERRGESIDETMKKAGYSKSAELVLQAEQRRFFTEDEARAATQKQLASIGIDPDWPIEKRIQRLIEIQRGAELDNGERFRANAYHVVAGNGTAGVFHELLKLRLKASNEAIVDRNPIRQQLLDAGCQSVSMSLAISAQPKEGKVLLELYTKLNKMSAGNDQYETSYDAFCHSWYGSEYKDTLKLVNDTITELKKLEKTFK